MKTRKTKKKKKKSENLTPIFVEIDEEKYQDIVNDLKMLERSKALEKLVDAFILSNPIDEGGEKQITDGTTS